MDQDWVVANGGWDGSCDTWQNFYAITSENSPFTPIANGTGPYKLDHWTKGQEIVLAANESYWRTEPAWEGGPTGAPAISRIVIKKVDEWGTRFAMAQAGDADHFTVNRENTSQVDPLVGERCDYVADTDDFDCKPTENPDQPLRLYIGYPTVTRTDVFFNFNITTEGGNPFVGSGQLDGNGIPADFFSDIHVRKAFNYCFDWDTFISDALVGEGVQSVGIPAPGMPGYDPNGPKYSYDPAKCEEEFKASELKSADGASLWDTGFRMQVAYNTGNTTRQTVAEILAQELSALNEKFQIEVIGLPWPTFLRAQRDQTLPVFISGWHEDIHDPHNWYVPYLTGTYGRRQSLPEDLINQFQELINQGVAETDPAKRNEIYSGLNQQVYDLAPNIILAFATGRHYEQRYDQGWYFNPAYSEAYYYAYSVK
jgi:peptide/nickel transport system substrate-binding protein